LGGGEAAGDRREQSLNLGLLLNVLGEHRRRRTATGDDAVRTTPENGFTPVNLPQVLGKLFANQAAGDRFQIKGIMHL